MPNDASRDLRVLLANSDGIAEEVLRVLEEGEEPWVVRRADSAAAYQGALEAFAPHVILATPEGEPPLLEALSMAQRRRPGSPFLIVARDCNASAIEALKAGAADFISVGDMARLRPAIQEALEERAPLRKLSNRQMEVLQLLSSGSSTRVIAERLNLSVKTVETHRAQVMKRVGIRDLAGLVRFSMQVGLVPAT